MRDRKIRKWVGTLIETFGDPRSLVDASPFEALHEEARYEEMFWLARSQYDFTAPVSFRLASAKDVPKPSRSGAWVRGWCHVTVQKRTFWQRLRGTRVRGAVQGAAVYCDAALTKSSSFQDVVITMAHELAHVHLDDRWHPLRNLEEAVDLTAMLFGFRDIYAVHATKVIRGLAEAKQYLRRLEERGERADIPEAMAVSISTGDLRPEEILYATQLMQM